MKNVTKTTMIEDAWQNYQAQVVHPKASPEQRKDMRDTFCAGAVLTLQIMLDGLPETEKDLKKFSALLAQLTQELQAYHDSLPEVH